MPRVFIPPQLRDLTGDRTEVAVDAQTVRGLIAELERQFPGIQARLQDGDRLTPGIAVSVDGVMYQQRGLFAPLQPDSEVHFLPALSGG